MASHRAPRGRNGSARILAPTEESLQTRSPTSPTNRFPFVAKECYAEVRDAFDLLGSMVKTVTPGDVDGAHSQRLDPGLDVGRALVDALSTHGDVAAAVESISQSWSEQQPPWQTEVSEGAEIAALEEASVAVQTANARATNAQTRATVAEALIADMAEEEKSQLSALEDAVRAVRAAEARATDAEEWARELGAKYERTVGRLSPGGRARGAGTSSTRTMERKAGRLSPVMSDERQSPRLSPPKHDGRNDNGGGGNKSNGGATLVGAAAALEGLGGEESTGRVGRGGGGRPTAFATIPPSHQETDEAWRARLISEAEWRQQQAADASAALATEERELELALLQRQHEAATAVVQRSTSPPSHTRGKTRLHAHTHTYTHQLKEPKREGA